MNEQRQINEFYKLKFNNDDKNINLEKCMIVFLIINLQVLCKIGIKEIFFTHCINKDLIHIYIIENIFYIINLSLLFDHKKYV